MKALKVKSKTKDKNGENVPYLEITKVVLIHCNIVNNSYQIQESCIHLFQINHWVNCKKFFQQVLSFKNVWFRIVVYWSMVYISIL